MLIVGWAKATAETDSATTNVVNIFFIEIMNLGGMTLIFMGLSQFLGSSYSRVNND